MKAIWSYDIPIEDKQTVRIPPGSFILQAEESDRYTPGVTLWAIVDPQVASFFDCQWIIYIRGTGQPLGDAETARYIDTITLSAGDTPLRFHVFDGGQVPS